MNMCLEFLYEQYPPSLLFCKVVNVRRSVTCHWMSNCHSLVETNQLENHNCVEMQQ